MNSRLFESAYLSVPLDFRVYLRLVAVVRSRHEFDYPASTAQIR
jgi:hypothetical protein